MTNNEYHQLRFIKSAQNMSQLPCDNGIEVAFAGRSNAGKSSAINAIAEQRKLAYHSKTPGRTQLINFFQLDQTRRVVDLPGYGYAKVAKVVQKHWQAMLENYLLNRHCLQGLFLIMDARHPLKALDESMIHWAVNSQISLHILLSKIDKLKVNAQNASLQFVTKTVQKIDSNITVQKFSATKGMGIVEAREHLNILFDIR